MVVNDDRDVKFFAEGHDVIKIVTQLGKMKPRVSVLWFGGLPKRGSYLIVLQHESSFNVIRKLRLVSLFEPS